MKQSNNRTIKVAVALSGGVDSAVAAKMLKDEGHEVIGLFLKLWKHDGADDTLFKSKKVAKFLKIPFYEIDAKAEFKRVVVQYFIFEYKNLRTPNPCTICNPQVKFKILIDKAVELGCSKLATGHYARVENAGNPKSQNLISNEISNNLLATRHSLLAGVDKSKDQSYMLYRLNQEQLSTIIFPLGELTKKEVREMAKKWDLPVAEQKESQEICFLQNTDYRDFLRRYLPAEYFESGDIVDMGGNVVGRHEGLMNYTVGQRRGIDQQNPNLETLNPNQIQNTKSKIQNDRHIRPDRESTYKSPLYVVGFDRSKNRLIVGEDSKIYKKEMIVSNLNWIVSEPTRYSLLATDLSVKIRSQAKLVGCRIANNESQITNHEIKVVFNEPQRAITPGQSAVFYLGDEVIGGGVICIN